MNAATLTQALEVVELAWKVNPGDVDEINLLNGLAFNLLPKLRALQGANEPPALSAAVIDVLAERRRQVDEEGWTAEHDDQHVTGSMARAAAAYALAGSSGGRIIGDELTPSIIERIWPWGRTWWKPKGQRRNLVRAAALCLAEIERGDRRLVDAKEARHA